MAKVMGTPDSEIESALDRQSWRLFKFFGWKAVAAAVAAIFTLGGIGAVWSDRMDAVELKATGAGIKAESALRRIDNVHEDLQVLKRSHDDFKAEFERWAGLPHASSK